ncbi:MAG: polyribonucleotide nucleotidyltransferase, partial [Candidatus Atribacteria bacterium]|nr:polyribonucleotide nucleotidyltransferase [Candidatus Atribacteria bacterium]
MASITTHSVEIKVGEKVIRIQTGKFAKQANAAVTVTCGETVVLVTAVASKEPKEGADFFPLLVDYEEKFYAAGKIPGGFFKREGKPSENAILTSRLIDRPLRPLFPENYFNDVQIITSVLSYDQENLPDVISIIGASAALSISDIPFIQPIGAVRIGMLNGEYVMNPSVEDLKQCQMNLVVAGTEDSVIMLEGEAKELPEESILLAIEKAQTEISNMVKIQKQFSQEIIKMKNISKMEPKDSDAEEKIKYYEFIKKEYSEQLEKALIVIDKKDREASIESILDEIISRLENDTKESGNEVNTSLIRSSFDVLSKEIVRKMILEKEMRADHRKIDEIRPIECEIGVLPRVHGSALFTRGQTQALVITTLGSVRDEQSIDTLEEDTSRKFYLHYNFPPFSVGDV